jgi:hypothetical protein
MQRWFEVYDNVRVLANWLVREQDYDTTDLLSYLEKPWKWEDEWREMRKQTAALFNVR